MDGVVALRADATTPVASARWREWKWGRRVVITNSNGGEEHKVEATNDGSFSEVGKQELPIQVGDAGISIVVCLTISFCMLDPALSVAEQHH